MNGRASWCETVGPNNPLNVARQLSFRSRNPSLPSSPSSPLFYPVSINDDDGGSTHVSVADEEESRTLRNLLMSMSVPANMSGSLRNESLSDTLGISLPSDPATARREPQPPATSRSQLLSWQRSPSMSNATPDRPYKNRPSRQGYGTMKTSSDGGQVPSGPLVNNIENGHGQESDSIQKLPFFMISLIVMFCGISSKFHSTVVDQYVYQRYANDITGNTTHTASDPCFHGSPGNDSQRELVKSVQDMSSQKILFIDLTLYGLGIPSCILLGMFSRSIGRKLQLFIPMFGYTAKCAGLVAIVYLEADLNWLFLPYAVEGITGNYVGVLLGLFLYTSDISGRSRSRTIAMVILEGIRGGTTAALNILVGHLIQDTGFKLPLWLSLGAASCALLLIFALPNRKPQLLSITASQKKAGYVQVQANSNPKWKTWFSMFVFPSGTFDNLNVRKLFISAFAATFLLLIGALGMKKVQSLYLMNEPICWSSSMIGWFSFGGELSSNMLTMFVGPFLIRCLPGMIVGILGMLSIAGGSIFLALATRGFELYFQPVVAIGQQLPMGVIRGELSRLVGPEAQGTMFATIAVLESFSFAIGSTFLYVYNATMSFYKGTVALVAAAILLVGASILIYFHRIWIRHYRDSQHLQHAVSIPEEKERISKHP